MGHRRGLYAASRAVVGSICSASARIAAALVIFLLGSGSAFAIPSPELVVGSFTSISQLLALGSALLGGGAAVATLRMRSRGRSSRALTAVALGSAALLIVSLGFNAYQYMAARNARAARLEATLVRPAHTEGGLPVDSEIKELNYTQQLTSPLGISTAEAEQLLAAHARGETKDVIFIDIREKAEHDAGGMPGVNWIRFPDLAASGIDLRGKHAVVFCHNGNRSSEFCLRMAALGIDCRFMIGGFEKWIVEGRSMTGFHARSLADLRAIPPYANQRTLLDTPDVQRLVADENVLFVDARYPGEFSLQHLPHAINIPLRRTPTAQLDRMIAGLPRRPIVIPCYDRRSCFMGEVLGLELTRAGYDFRGRYTLPWEYFVAADPPPHVAQFIEQERATFRARMGERLADLLTLLGRWIGLVPAILLLALVSRLLVLPFSLKAERDQIKSRAVGDDLAALKAGLKDDPPRMARAIGAFYRRHRITPLRNLIALLFLPIMALAMTAVQRAASNGGQHFGWISDLAARDRWFVLPALFAALITLYIDLAFVRTARQRLIVWATVFPLFVATGALFSAGTDLYLVASAALLIVQRLVVSGVPGRMRRAWRRWRLGPGVIGLSDPEALADHGNKAYRLARMRAAGLPVPDGVLLTPVFLAALARDTAGKRRARLDRVWRALGTRRLAVRSSARGEDNAERSFAGVFESVLDVDRDGLEDAILRVRASFEAARVDAYTAPRTAGSVLAQQMIAAEFAGVLFTRDPSAGGLAMVEMVKGTAENLVSGTVRPWTFRFGRVSGRQSGDGVAPIDLAPLLALGRRAEALFARPQDIEWTYADGRFHLVQSRDITRVIAGDRDRAVVQDDLARLLDVAAGAAAEQVVFAKNELSEMLPRPTASSLSLMQALWASGGSVDRAARALGFSYAIAEDSTYLTTVLGRLYVDKREEQARGFSIGRLASRRLIRRADRIERTFREEFLPHFLADVRMLEAVDFDRLSIAELVEEIGRLRARFVGDTHVEVDIVNIAASFYLERARRGLSKAGLDPSSFLAHIPETLESHAIAEAAAAPAESRHWFLVRSVGHRATFDYELAEPRYAENPEALSLVVAAKGDLPHAGPAGDAALRKRLAALVAIARRFETLKEDAKHQSLRQLAVLRRAMLALDHHLGWGGLVFHLTFDEIATIRGRDVPALREVGLRRRDDTARLGREAPLPALLTVAAIEAASCGETVDAPAQDGAIRGTRVAGSHPVVGRARVVSEMDAERGAVVGDFADGDVIVAPMINPNWLPFFARAGGFVSEVGGWLSHTAILAREHDVIMIVGTQGIAAIADGSLLRLNLDGRVEVLDAQPVGKIAAA
ncbi:MAG TPA: PEP/pyruvate-binding domain-containing protein [Xanthobacteraceae bacterium]